MRVDLGHACVVGVGSAAGGRARNEDNYLICMDGVSRWRDGAGEHREPAVGDGVLVAVCDGMGGGQDGHIASASAVRVLARLYRPEPPLDLARALRRYVLDTHRRMHDRAAEAGPVVLGTTLLVAWWAWDRLSWVHVGDSRLYILRNGALEQLSRDHTRGEFAARDGGDAGADRDVLAQTYIYGSRGLGDDPGLRLDEGLDSADLELQPGDRVLLCSDGVYAVLTEHALAAELGGAESPHDAVNSVVRRAMAAGSTDNLTAITLFASA